MPYENHQAESNESPVEELTHIMNEKISADSEALENAHDFSLKLLREIGQDELVKYQLFHVISFSTIPSTIATEIDLPDGRIERFIREEL